MKLDDVREVLQAIADGHVFWSGSSLSVRVRFYRLDDPVTVDGTTRAPSPDLATIFGAPLPIMDKLSERFYHREGWEGGGRSGPVSLTWAGEKELAELSGAPTRSVWSR